MKKLCSTKMRFVVFPILGIGFVFLVSFVVMKLWNYVLPDLFGFEMITLWQAMALFFLCKILFGFGGGGRRGGPWKRRSRCNDFSKLSDEEKEKFKASMSSRMQMWRRNCGFSSDADDERKEPEN